MSALERHVRRIWDGHILESTRWGRGSALERLPHFTTYGVYPQRAGEAWVYVTVGSSAWPWNEVDPNSIVQWNGLHSIPRTSNAPDWDSEPFRVVFPNGVSESQEICEVGILDAAAHVVAIDEFLEPLDVGWLPRLRVYVSLVGYGVRIAPTADEIGFTLDPGGGEPIEAELIHRPYAFLQDGDEVVDCAGRVWTFSVPWCWTPFDNGLGDAPVWPLKLICREGEADPQGAERVGRVTSSGTHSDEIACWLERAGLDEAPQLPLAGD